jgi:hypothetical protein
MAILWENTIERAISQGYCPKPYDTRFFYLWVIARKE